MKLQELYNTLIAEGCNNFYIDGVGGGMPDDVHCLGKIGQEWAVYYVERGQKSSPIFSSPSQEEAIKYYHTFVSDTKHWHMVVFTRSDEIVEKYREALNQRNIEVKQNDIPHYSKTNDRVYRLFVVNKDIFKVRELFDVVPFYDADLKR